MFGSVILDVAIGLSLIYFLFSLIMTSITEALSQAVGKRANTLEDGLKNLFYWDESNSDTQKQSQEFLDSFYKHPLIYALYRGNGENAKKPSYIPSDVFATVVVDILHKSSDGIKTIESLRENLKKQTDDKNSQNQQLAQALLVLIDNSENDLAKLKQNVAKWFDASMDRVSGWYKQWTHQIILGVSIVVIAACNVDSINLTTALMNDKVLRDGMVTAAQGVVENASASMVINASGSLQPGESTKIIKQIQNDMIGLPLPIGWGEYQKEILKHNQNNLFNYAILKIIGLALTVFAVSLGAPFWFDILSKLVNIRTSGTRPGGGGPSGKNESGAQQPITVSINTTGTAQSSNSLVTKEYYND